MVGATNNERLGYLVYSKYSLKIISRNCELMYLLLSKHLNQVKIWRMLGYLLMDVSFTKLPAKGWKDFAEYVQF